MHFKDSMGRAKKKTSPLTFPDAIIFVAFKRLYTATATFRSVLQLLKRPFTVQFTNP